MTKYINPFTDFGFKKIFGEEASKPILLDFLNSLLPQSSQIKDLSFKNYYQLGDLKDSRKLILDLYCENEKGEKIIVQLLKARQNFFKNRTIYYSTFPICVQAEKNELESDLIAVYCIGILDFTFKDYSGKDEKNRVVYERKMNHEEGSQLYEKLNFIYLEIPNFKKEVSELDTRLEKWLYFLKHLNDLDHIPAVFTNEAVFSHAFEKAEIWALSQTEYIDYINSMKGYSDLEALIESAVDEAVIRALSKVESEKNEALKDVELEKQQALARLELEKQLAIEATEKKARLNMAKELKKNGVDIHLIQSITGIINEDLDLLLNQIPLPPI